MKPVFKLENYSDNVVMHCPEEWMAERFCKLLHDDGRKWANGDSYISKTYWEDEGSETCYLFGQGGYDRKKFFDELGYSVLEYEDFNWENKEGTMTKEDISEMLDLSIKQIELLQKSGNDKQAADYGLMFIKMLKTMHEQ